MFNGIVCFPRAPIFFSGPGISIVDVWWRTRWLAVTRGVFYVVVTLLTAGIALPYCLFMLGEMLLNHTELSEVGQAG